MKKASKLFILLTAAVCLCGCNNRQNIMSSGGYVDVYEYVSSIENEKIENDTQFENHQFDDKAYNTMSVEFTVNGDYLYAVGMKNLRINAKSGEVQALCSKAGCAHDTDSLDCTAYKKMQSPLSSPDGIYYCIDNKLCLYDGKNHIVILRNDFCTEYEEETYPENQYLIRLMYSDGLFYLMGPTYYFTYNPSSGEKSEPVVVADSVMRSMSIGGENLYYATDTAELYIYNILSGERKKLDDNVWKLDFVNDLLYYIKYENGIPMLYRADKNGDNANKIIEDCYVNCAITEDCIYYQNYNDSERSVNICGLNGSDPKKITFPKMKIINEEGEEVEEEEEYQVDLVNIITSSSSDKVFMVSLARVYIFDKGSDKGEFISLADHWEYWGE